MIREFFTAPLMAALTGQALLDKIKELGDVSKDVLARETGYVRVKKDGAEAFRFTSLYEATIAASTGVHIGGKASSAAKPGRSLSYVTTVSKAGAALVGKGYLAALGAEEGDELDIAVDAEAGTITLKLPPLAEEEAEDGEAAAA